MRNRVNRNRVNQNPHHPGTTFEFAWFNRVRFAIPLRLETMGPVLITQWTFLRTYGFSMLQITYLSVLYLYDSTILTQEMSRMLYVASQLHAEQLQEVDITDIRPCRDTRSQLPNVYCRLYLHHLEACCRLPDPEVLYRLCRTIWDIENNNSTPVQDIEEIVTQTIVNMRFPCTRCSIPCHSTCTHCTSPSFIPMPPGEPSNQSFRRACSTCRACDRCP